MRRSRARPICKREGCKKKVTKLAAKFGDPYCSRVCLRIDLKLPEPKGIWARREPIPIEEIRRLTHGRNVGR